MVESIFVENMFGVKSYFNVDIISKSVDQKNITIKTWSGEELKLILDEKKKCYVVETKCVY